MNFSIAKQFSGQCFRKHMTFNGMLTAVRYRGTNKFLSKFGHLFD